MMTEVEVREYESRMAGIECDREAYIYDVTQCVMDSLKTGYWEANTIVRGYVRGGGIGQGKQESMTPAEHAHRIVERLAG